VSKRIIWVFAVFLSMSVLISACAGGSKSETADQDSTEISEQETMEADVSTEKMTDKSAEDTMAESSENSEEISAETTEKGFAFEKLDALDSYKLNVKMEALGGPAVGYQPKFEASYDNTNDAYQAISYASRDGQEYTIQDECVVIGETTWNKSYGKEWEVSYTIADSYKVVFSGLNIVLKSADVNRIEETEIGGIHTIHYSFSHGAAQDSENYMEGEIWVADQSDLPPVIIKAFAEQGFLDDAGELIVDASNAKWEYEVSEINSAISIVPPM